MNKLFKDIGCSRSWLGAYDVIGAVAQSSATQYAANMNYEAQIETNASNERNVAATNQANKEMTEATNASNLQQVRETNEANLQIQQMANDLQISESEKAYQRSTATNQIAELVRAGYSTQQAKQIVAGSGSPATYQPAQIGAAQMQAGQSVAPQNQAFQATAPYLDPAAMGSGMSQVFSSIGDAFTAPDGGAPGAVFASGAMSFLSENASEIDELSDHSVNTFTDFEQWAKSQPEDSKYRKFVEDKSWTRCKKFLPAMRAINSHMKNIFAENRSTSLNIEHMQKELEAQAIKNRIDTVTANIAEHGMDLEFLRQDLEKENLPTLMYADYVLALKSISEASLDATIASNPEYRKQRIARALQDEKTQFITAKVLELKQQIIEKGIASLSDEQKQFLGVYSCYDSFGLSASDYTAALSFMEASGVHVTDMLRKAVKWLESQFDDGSDSDSPLSVDVPESLSGDAIVDARRNKGLSDKEKSVFRKAGEKLGKVLVEVGTAQGTSYR